MKQQTTPRAAIYNDIARTKELLESEQISAQNGARSLFLLGYELEKIGDRSSADSVYRDTINMLDHLVSNQTKKITPYDYTRLAINHGRNMLTLGRLEPACAAFREAVLRFELLIHSDVSRPLIDQYARAVRLLALTLRLLDRPKEAIIFYKRAASLYGSLLLFSTPQFEYYSQMLQSCISGYRKCSPAHAKKDRQKPPSF
ncbi:hypothetical protein JNK13_00885 [bacterium]|nr:hypothetical protein [bacterium]